MKKDEIGYKLLISTLIKCEERIVGKVAIIIAKEIKGLEIDEEGNVVKITNGEKIFNKLFQEYKKYGFGLVTVLVKPHIKEILKKYPNLKIPKDLL
ncbi:MAG: hypothetical protein NZ942_00840 [Candidatus Aenigmarchaeota archaeon]|nr:hypothetical protein [Candidatus Aenigmarchaeota archaeon]